mmetsp:Transcript_32055/g.68289  ORF Transcript_32055/g.68289 Transcript_32055/m.68289 type:complete len:184 (-) Transcript_32055:73-624(-)
MSWRGLRECIKCESGDFCAGCDVFQRCPENTQEGREGPRISSPGATRISDCESCPAGQEASFLRNMCVDKYSDVCNEAFVSRCIRNCEAEDTSMGKNLNECEVLKCTMYCSKRWSDDCAAAVRSTCKYMTKPPDQVASSFFAGELEGKLWDCDVDCSGAPARHAASFLAVVALMLSWAAHGAP